jgi:hypothetical protein
MTRPAALFVISLALGPMVLAPGAGAQGPTEITACQTLDKPGAYRVVNNLTAPTNHDCLVIVVSPVTVDLGGFTIVGSGSSGGNGILANFEGDITVRNGSIEGFFQSGVNLGLDNTVIVEGLHVFCGSGKGNGIVVSQEAKTSGIVKGNTVTQCELGIVATGTITGNIVNNGIDGIVASQGSTVIGNTVTNNAQFGIFASCPSNVTNNTAFGNATNLVLLGIFSTACNNTNNVAP